MRRLAVAMVLVVGALGSCGATLSVRGTAPTQLNDGACSAPILSTASSLQRVHAQVIGAGKEDSVTVNPGAPFSFSWNLPAGTYQVRAWASIAGSPQFVGCDTIATFQAGAPPHRVTLQ